MRSITLCLIAGLALSFAVTTPSQAQSADSASTAATAAPMDVKTILSGGIYPLTLHLSDLTPAWRQFKVGAVDQGLSSLGAYMSVLSGGQSLGGEYFTNAQTITLGDTTYLVAYRLPSKAMDYSVILGQTNDTSGLPDPTSPSSTITLTLLNLRTIGAIDQIQPFDIDALIRSSNAQRAQLAAALGQRSDLEAQTNLQQLATALLQETDDNSDTIPAIQSISALKRALRRDIHDESLYIDPLTHRPFFTNPFLSGHKITDYTDPSNTVLLYADSPGQDGLRAVAFLDGGVRMVDRDDWSKLQVSQHLP